MNNIVDEYLRQLDEHTVGAIWFSNEEPTIQTPLHELFNYLVDGQVIKFLEYAKTNKANLEQENMFFIGKNFDNPFIVFNSSTSKNFSNGDFNDFKMILKKFEDHDRNKLAIFHPEDYPLPKIIKNSTFDIVSIIY